MKKQLCILLSISLSIPFYAQHETPAISTPKINFESGKFNNATITIQYKNFNGTQETRTMTTADHPIYMSRENTAAYLTQDKLQWFCHNMAIGMLIGIAVGVFLSWFSTCLQTPRTIVRKPETNK